MPKSVKSKNLTQFCKALKSYDRFLLACHVAPEGDAIGSILAMESLLRRMGKKTTVIAEDVFPQRLFCLSSKRWRQVDEIKAKPSDFQALVLADCPTLERTGRVKEFVTPKTVIFNIDHHVSNSNFGHYNYVLPTAAASGEVVFDIFKYFKMPLTKEDAVNLYVALSTDTGSFKNGNTTVKSHRMAAELIGHGIDLDKINDDIYSTYSLNKINLYSRLLGKVKTALGGRVAWVGMRREDLIQTGATEEDTEGFIDFLKCLREVKVAFFMSEYLNKSDIRVSFRSKESYDVNKVAICFKGGGHKKAAGCVMHCSLEEAEKEILNCIKKKFRFS